MLDLDLEFVYCSDEDREQFSREEEVVPDFDWKDEKAQRLERWLKVHDY